MAFNYTLDRNNVDKGATVQLPIDQAYVCKIIAVKEIDETKKNSQGEEYRIHRLDVALDVCEGEYAGYYQGRFDSDQSEDKKWKGVVKLNIPTGDGTEQDSWRIRSFNTALCNIEDSNPGYTWDNNLAHLKGKLIGMTVQNTEWVQGDKSGFYSAPYKLIKVDDARNGNFYQPKTKYKNGKAPTATPSAVDASGFVAVADNSTEEIPF